MANNSNNSSKSKSSYISVFEKFKFKDDLINFYNEYKDKIQDILELIYQELGRPKINEKLHNNQDIINKLKTNPIVLKEYNLKCIYAFNKIQLLKISETNCCLEIKYFSKMHIKSDNNDNKELWVCNNHISMILADNKYLYYSKNDKIIENEKECDIDDISIITNFDCLEEGIG